MCQLTPKMAVLGYFTVWETEWAAIKWPEKVSNRQILLCFKKESYENLMNLHTLFLR